MISTYAKIRGPRIRPAIPKTNRPPMVPITLRTIGRFELRERKYGLRKLSIIETKSAPYKRIKIPENTLPVAKRITPTGSQTSQDPSTGIIEAMQVMTVSNNAFGTPKKNNAAPSARP